MDIFSIILLILLLVGSAFFSSSETAILSITPARANYLAKKNKKGKQIKEMKDKLDDTIIAILLGNNLVNIGGTALATGIFLELLKGLGIAVSTAIMTILILTFGEILPKIFASNDPERYLLKFGSILYEWVWLSQPLVTIYKYLSDYLKEKLRVSSPPTVTEEEIEELVKIGEKEGEVEKAEREIIINALDFGDTRAEDLMTVREQIFALPEYNTIQQLIKAMKKAGVNYTRIPIYIGDLDNITGIVNIKEIVELIGRKGWKEILLKDIAHKPLFIGAKTPLSKVLKLMKKRRQFMAIVVDEDEKTEGLITMKDILEDLVGEIYDEVDEVSRDIRKVGEGYYIIRGSVSLNTLKDLLNIHFKQEGLTIQEFIEERLGKAFKIDGRNVLAYKGYLFVLDDDKNMIEVRKIGNNEKKKRRKRF